MRDLKILLIPIIIIILLVMGLLFGLRIYGDYNPSNENVKSLNMKNPLEPTKEYYVKTTKPVKEKPKEEANQTHEYETTGYDKKGNSKKIKYVGMKRLKLNHYLKIKQKLDTVKSYEEVKKDDIPKEARKHLN
ncbi:YxeA family protein [Shigella flexneri]|uniref:YxeA family protein n=1 Tax=Shigella flexneri TaxID=623 RepID=UPI0012E75F8C|nr:YxeA family protein [Shigella flexneri]MUX42249.1 YxeA family protein [Shigella flexneri]